ncbi:hypothetical protein SDC9_167376 [bioreactor metagenome]|uniref:Uncharacterized protein n=1 Tax=bioreactor metagenome TaxID=1076179 RepID=A0A645G274_9ZZZZ|nr:hypothetical protein [Oscillospiraceae bacterium]
MNDENLIPFNHMPLEQHQKLSRRGGIASGERRRYLSELKLCMIETLAGEALADEVREDYRRAIKRYLREEKAKRERTTKKPQKKQ